MADTSIKVTEGTGPEVDFRTEGTSGNYRQVICIGDPSTNSGVAPVDGVLGLSVDVTNPSLTMSSPSVDSVSVSSVSASVTTVTLDAANTNRVGLILFNDSSSICYVKFGISASTSDYSFKVFPQSAYEMTSPIYRGIVTGVWDTADGSMKVTEY